MLEIIVHVFVLVPLFSIIKEAKKPLSTKATLAFLIFSLASMLQVYEFLLKGITIGANKLSNREEAELLRFDGGVSQRLH